MRVLVLVHGFPPLAQGGSEVYAGAHARTLLAMGHDVCVVAREADITRPERAVRIEQQDGLRVAWVNNTFADTTTIADSYEHPRLAHAVLPLIDAYRPDVAHVHHLTCLSTRLAFALAERRVPIVYTLHDYWLMCHRGQLLDRDYRVCAGPGQAGCGHCIGDAAGAVSSALKGSGLAGMAARTLPAAASRRLASAVGRLGAGHGAAAGGALERARLTHMRAVCSCISHFLAPSQHMRDAFIRFGIDEARITWSPYGFDRAAFLPPASPTAATRPRPLQIGFVGTLMVSKGPHVLLDAYRLLEPGSAELHLYGAQAAYHGDDSYRERLMPLLASPGVHVHGPRPHDRIPAALRQLDVLVVPSVWPENSPLVIHEALLSRVAVVAARTGGITELITDGQNGYLFEPGDVEGLARLLDRLARHPEALAIVSTGAPGIRTIHADVQATVALYERLASATARARPVTRVAAVVVHHRTTEDTGIALRALRASARPFDDVVVVNNDGEPAAEGLPALATTWIDAGANLGFSGGVNLGVRAALDRGATHVLLVNSDVVVPPDTAERLMAALDQVPGAGIAGPVVASRTRPDTIASAGIRYSRPTGRMRHRRFGEPVDRLPPSGPELVDAVSGCVMLVRREVFDRAGVFDDDYFYGFEDIDFCLTAQARGYRTVLAADAVVYHHGGQSIGPESPRRLYFGVRNHLLLASRLSDGDLRFTRLVRGVNIVMLNVAHAIARPGGVRLNGLRAVARGIADYASGTFGAGR